jgi:ketosteroid isomerase-like protein
MAVVSAEVARAFAAEWIAGWNSHDVERVLSHYTEDVEASSPFIVSIAGEPSGKLSGKTALRAYWTRALQMLPTLHFELIEVLAGNDSITIYYRGHRGTVAETFGLDASHNVRWFTSCYGL